MLAGAVGRRGRREARGHVGGEEVHVAVAVDGLEAGAVLQQGRGGRAGDGSGAPRSPHGASSSPGTARASQ